MALKPQTRREHKPRPQHKLKTTERGYGWDWQQFRERIVRERPLCEDCLDEGKVSPTEEVHHMVKIKDAPHRKLDQSNVRCLCRPHHTARTARGE